MSRPITQIVLSWPICASLLAGLSTPLAYAKSGCQIQTARIPFELRNRKAISTLKLNGHGVEFIVDTGAFWSTVSAAKAEEIGLKRTLTPPGFSMAGVGGSVSATLVRAEQVEFLGLTLKNIEFVAGGTDSGAGLLGQNVLFIANDLDLDLANDILGLVSAKDCSDTSLAYWASPTVHYEEATLLRDDNNIHRPRVEVMLNGKRVTALFDTGAGTTTISRAAARKIGIDLDAKDAPPSDAQYGIGSKLVRSWKKIPIKQMQIGSESIQNTFVSVIDQDLAGNDMVLGIDFMMAHHLLISYSQHKVYMTYNGGRLYSQADPPKAALKGGNEADETQLLTADEYFKLGAGEEQRGETQAALKNYDRAIQLDDSVDNYRFARARLLFNQGQTSQALVDINELLSRKPDWVDALMLRLSIAERLKDTTRVEQDRQHLLSLIPRGSMESYNIARFMIADGQFAQALPLLEGWLVKHPEDVRRAYAWQFQCLAKAMINQDLKGALKACKQGLQVSKGSAAGWQAMGYVEYRLGHYQQALDDFTKALQLDADLSWAPYGLALAYLQLNQVDKARETLKSVKHPSKNRYATLVQLGFELDTIGPATSDP